MTHQEEYTKLGMLVRKVSLGHLLTETEAFDAMSMILNDTSGESDFYWGSLFSCLQLRTPTLAEISGFLGAIARYDKDVKLCNNDKKKIFNKPVFAVTGSGKDTWKTFNISTASAFVAASCGVTVIKPGSNALTSKSGALQVLKSLGIKEAVNDAEVRRYLKETNLAIISFANCVPRYARRYDGRFYHFHPLSYIMPIVAIPYKLDGISYGISDNNIELSLELIREYGIPNAVVSTSFDRKMGQTDELIPYGIGKTAILTGWETSYKKLINKLPGAVANTICAENSHKKNADKVLNAISSNRNNPLARCAATMAATILVAADKVTSIESGYDVAMKAIENGDAYQTYLKYKQVSNS